MKPELIGLTGYAQSGKSTVADYLYKKYDYEQVAFASRLKGMLGLGLGLTLDELYGARKDLPCARLLGVTPRHAMQTLGTEWGRHLIHPDLWCSITLEQIELADLPLVVIEDVRFENEAQLIHKAGGVIWRTQRESIKTSQHASEHDQVYIIPERVISNNNTLADLFRIIDTIMEGYYDV